VASVSLVKKTILKDEVNRVFNVFYAMHQLLQDSLSDH
jgi:hypothetical protein